MTHSQYQIRQLADEIQPPDSGKQSVILFDDDHTKVVLFAFAAGHGLSSEHGGGDATLWDRDTVSVFGQSMVEVRQKQNPCKCRGFVSIRKA